MNGDVGALRLPDGRERAVAVGFLVVACVSPQLGAALAVTLFDELGPAGAAFLRLAFAAIILMVIWRPRLAGDLRLPVAFGVSLGAPATLRFRPYPPDAPKRADVLKLTVEPRSIYALRGPSRWAWQHSAAPVEGLRWSITFRTARAK